MAAVDKPLQRVLAGFIRMHVLHHADEGNLCGNWMIEELRHHGYHISAGTLYPMLRTMERDGWITGRADPGQARRRLYRITPKGRTALAEARARLQELFREVGAHGRRGPTKAVEATKRFPPGVGAHGTHGPTKPAPKVRKRHE